MNGVAPFASRPLTPSELGRIAEIARRLWSIYSAGLVIGTSIAQTSDRVGLNIARSAARGPNEYPSLIDERLVWFMLENFNPGSVIVAMWFFADHTVDQTFSRTLPRRTTMAVFEVFVRQVAWEAMRSLLGTLSPAHEHMGPGRGAWEHAAELAATKGSCNACPFRLGSNLDCPVCRAQVLGHKLPTAAWDRAAVQGGLLALGFDVEVAKKAAASAEEALAQVEAPILTPEFFGQWGIGFAATSSDVFENEDDRVVARDIIEAQMMQPWFALPPRRPPSPRRLQVPPVLSEAAIKSQARRMIREMLAKGLPRDEAVRRVRTLQVLRKLFRAKAELVGADARVSGDLNGIRLVIEQGGRPVLSMAATPLGARVEVSPELGEAERERLLDRLEAAHNRLMRAVNVERAALKIDNEGRSIDRAMQNLRRSPDHYEERTIVASEGRVQR